MSRLRATRVEKGLTLRGAADGAGISAEYLRRLELEIHKPTLVVARKLSSFYGLSVDSLFPTAESLVAPSSSKRRRVA
jgi:transcriptional regulator with XRE-family HTH domain